MCSSVRTTCQVFLAPNSSDLRTQASVQVVRGDKELQRIVIRPSDPSRQLCSPTGGWGWDPSSRLQVPGAAPAHVRCSRVMGPYGDTGGTAGDLPQCLPEADVSGPSTTVLLATTGQTSMAGLLR